MQSTTIIWYTLLLCIALCPIPTRGALTQGEKDALTGLLHAFPNLAFIPTSEITVDNGNDYGRHWTQNFDILCLGSDGYEYYGLYCENGHISGVVLTQAWAPGNESLNYSFVSDLSNVRNVTVLTPSSPSITNLVMALANHPLVHLWFTPSVLFNSRDIKFPSSMKNMSIGLLAGSDLTPFINLQQFHLTVSDYTQLSNSGIWPSSLEWLKIDGLVDNSDLQDLVRNLTYLKSLTAKPTRNDIGSLNLESDSLETLDISFDTFGYSIFVILNCSSLKSASITFLSEEGEVVSWVLDTPNLRTFSLEHYEGAFPESFFQLTQLEQLSFKKVHPYVGFPDLSFAPNLTRLDLVDSLVEPSVLSLVLCNASQYNVQLSHLGLLELRGVLSGKIYNLPNCLRDTLQLKSVDLSGNTLMDARFNATSVLYALPQSIEHLSFLNAFPDAITPANLTQFSQLKTLHASVVNGEMHNDFLLNFPQLEDLNLVGSVNGTIPSVGWAKLRRVRLFTQHNIWPGVDSAPFLKFLQIYSQSLETLPNDTQLQNLSELEEFHLTTSSTVAIPTPRFWTHLPKIQSVSITDCNLTGPIISTLAAPRLVSLQLFRNGICATLPDFAVPMSLTSLMLGTNLFSGSIPESWVTNLTIRSYLSLDDNRLSGTIPPNFLNRKNPYFAGAVLSNNYFSGPVWHLFENYPTSSLFLSSNNFNICETNPYLPSNASIMCRFEDNLVCPSDVVGCNAFWTGCATISCSSRASQRIIPDTPECIYSIPPNPVAVMTCPPPGPPGFECVNGQWISKGSVTIPSTTLPPNGGVIIVNGNLSTNGSLTFDGIGTAIVVEGCVENLPTEVVIVLEGDDKLKTTTLITQKGSRCDNDLSSIPVSLIQDKDSCRQVKSSTKGSTRSSLIVAFDIDSSRCNTKWIILGSVLGGIIILFAAGVAILYQVNPRFKSFVRSCKREKSQ